LSPRHAARWNGLGTARVYRERAGHHRPLGHRHHAARAAPPRLSPYCTVVTTRSRMMEPYSLGPMPADRSMTTVDEIVTPASLAVIFALAADVERWPTHLSHYRYVRFLERRPDGGGLVEMSANRPFG